MPLTAGTRVGTYEIFSQLGATATPPRQLVVIRDWLAGMERRLPAGGR